MQLTDLKLISCPPEANDLCFCTVLFSFLVYAVKVKGRMVNPGDLVLGQEMTGALAGGCRANNVRQ